MIGKKQYSLLIKLINSRNKQSNKIFDKHDYCFQKSVREIAEITGDSKSTIGRLFTSLKEKGLAKVVLDNANSQRLMLNPSFINLSRKKHYKWYNSAMYHLGSDERAREYSKQCKLDGVLYDYETFGEVIDFDTGEVTYGKIIRKLTQYEQKSWFEDKNEYSSTDRTKRRGGDTVIHLSEIVC